MVSEEQFGRMIVEASPDGILLVDADGTILRANGRVAELFGYDAAELEGSPVELLVPGGFREDHVDQREGFMANPEPRPMGIGLDLTAQRKDGSIFPVEISLAPVTLDDEVAVLASVRDTSEQAAVRTKYRAIMETAPDAVFVADADTGSLIEVNQRAAELTGYSTRELERMDQAALHPRDEADRYRELFEHHVLDEGVRSQFPDGQPIYVETKTGERIPVEINARRFSLGDRELVTGAFRDITDRRARIRELERAETVIQASGDPAYMVDSAEQFVFVNEAIERLTGYDESELLGAHLSLVVDDADVRDAARISRELLEEPMDRQTFEMSVETAGGETIPTENHVAIIETNRGDLEATVGVVRDISERKARESELARKNERLDEFASIVAHDLRNPLAIAKGRIELGIDGCEGEDLTSVNQALDRMDDIIKDTLSLTRQGEPVGERTAVDLAYLAEACWATVSTGDASLEVSAAPTIEADRSRLQQLLENVFRNAAEHNDSDVSVRVGGLEEGFFVEDDGEGIPPEDRSRVFEAGTSSGEGTGLGLAIVKGVVEAHGWEIEITEGDAGGARFEITGIEVLEG